MLTSRTRNKVKKLVRVWVRVGVRFGVRVWVKKITTNRHWQHAETRPIPRDGGGGVYWCIR